MDFEAKVILPMCGQCYDPKPDVRDQLSYRMKIPAKKIEQSIQAETSYKTS